MVSACIECGVELSVRQGPGQPRRRCDRCAPPRNRTRRTVQASVSSVESAPRAPGAVSEVVRAHLSKVTTGSSVPAALAVHLAEQLDAGGNTASGTAALTRELLNCVQEAGRAAPKPDIIDEIFERRQRKAGEAG